MENQIVDNDESLENRLGDAILMKHYLMNCS